MKKFLVLSIMIFCVFVPLAIAANRPDQVLSLGAGYFGGMPGLSIDLMSHVPRSVLGTNDLYIRVGFAGTDSNVLTPDKDWRKFLPLYVDAVYYLYGDTYFGIGLNYPIKVTDDEVGNIGGEAYLGMDMDIGILGKAYIEAGWGALRRTEGDHFEGLHGMIGWRYDLIPASEAPAAVTPPPPPPAPAPAPEVVPAPSPEVAPAATPETVTKATPEQIARIQAEITALEAELVKAQDYVKVLDQKIARVTAAGGDKAKLADLNYLRADAAQRAWVTQVQLDSKKAQESTMQQ
jgi:hypothetical protein